MLLEQPAANPTRQSLQTDAPTPISSADILLMATVGHTLVGLSLGGLCPAKARNRAMPYVWTGLVVLMAHLVDLLEWAVLLLGPGTTKTHFLTHSAFMVAGVVVLIWIVIATATRLRKPFAYLIIAAAVFSHLLLDHPLIRAWTLEASGIHHGPEPGPPRLFQNILAEIWLYGLPLVGVMLWRAGRQSVCPRRGRIACGLLGGLAIVATLSRKIALWGPAYLLAAGHAGLLLRRELKPRLLWSLLPVTPLLIFLGVELAAARLAHQADLLRKHGNDTQAIPLYLDALRYPTRSAHARTYLGLSQCYQHLGRLSDAQAVLQDARRNSHGSIWPDYWLAYFYANPRHRGTPYFQPRRAAKMFRQIRDHAVEKNARHAAQVMLKRLKTGGWIN